MKVELIDYTGAGSPDPLYAAKKLIAAKSTRLGKGIDVAAHVAAMSEEKLNEELAYIANTIRSSWEFVEYTFKISEISRACCDQIVRSRVGVSFAVMAMRVVDQSGFDYIVPNTIAAIPSLKIGFDQHMSATRDFYQTLISAGIPAQDARAVIPMCAESPLTAQYNLRSLADIVAKRENLRAQGEYVEVAAEMKRLVMEVHPWTKNFLDPERKQTPALDELLKSILGSGGPLDNPKLNEALKELDKLKAVWG